jgi:prepilin-type N-terminal cleavage/methylation domain-containing protein
MKQKGFTLIELLVVISIIGILAGLTLTGFGAARKNARDTERKSDLAQYKATVEAYAANNGGNYPGDTSCGGGTCDGNSNAPNGLFGSSSAIIPDYLPERIDDPSAPSTTYRYEYRSNASGSLYVLSGALETGGYWELCSIGKAGLVTGSAPTDENCDL